MSRDKQIEEMVRIVCIQMRDYPKLTCKKCKANNRSTNAYCRIQFEMERLYNAGYRKVVEQSETARECKEGVDNGFSSSVTESAMRAEVAEEIFADLEKIIEVDNEGKASFDIREFHHKIEKKYTKSEKGNDNTWVDLLDYSCDSSIFVGISGWHQN